MSDGVKKALDEATEAFNAGRFGKARELSQNVLASEPENAEATLIFAVSSSQIGDKTGASDAFSRAIELDVTNPKVRFNAAVHEFNAGNLGLAKALAEQALSLDPDHVGSKALLEKIPADSSLISNYTRVPENQFETTHAGIPFITRLGNKWVAIGWTVAVLSLVVFVATLVRQLPYMPELMDAAMKQDQAQIQGIMKKLSNPVIDLLGFALNVANLLFVLLDLIHRRGNMLWLIGNIPCNCVGLGFFSTPAYLLFGRK